MAEKRKSPPREHWQEESAEHDYPAAAAYLSLLLPEPAAASIVERLREAPLVRRRAKDLLRASRLELLPVSDLEVRKELKRVAGGERLSPVLVVRGREGGPLLVADRLPPDLRELSPR